MNLQDFAAVEPQHFEAEFPEEGTGFWITLRYLPAEELRRLQRDAANKSLVIKGGQVRSKNEEGQALINDALARLIVAWRGFTPRLAASLVPGLKVGAIEKALKKEGLTEIPCEEENKLFLVRQVHGLAGFIETNSAEAANFQAEELEAQIKN